MKIVLERLSGTIEISEPCRKYRITTKRMHSSLNYLTPRNYYRGDPDELLRLREEKIRIGRTLRKETNMKDRKGGVMAGATS